MKRTGTNITKEHLSILRIIKIMKRNKRRTFISSDLNYGTSNPNVRLRLKLLKRLGIIERVPVFYGVGDRNGYKKVQGYKYIQDKPTLK